MKKWIVLLGGALFCVLFLSMYLVVDQLGRLPTSQEIFQAEVGCEGLQKQFSMQLLHVVAFNSPPKAVYESS